MSLSGSTKTIDLADLLQWSASAKKVGRFDFRNGPSIKEVYVQDGIIVAAASNQATELLGHHLIARGMLNEEQLRAALTARKDTDEFIGQILVRLGFVPRENLLRALSDRTEEIVYSLFEWESADFHFEPGSRPGPRMVLTSLSVSHVLLKGVCRHDEMREVRKVFPHGKVILGRGGASPPETIRRHPLGQRVMASVNGKRTIEEIAFALHANLFPVMKFLYEAHKLNLVTVVSCDGAPMMLSLLDAPEAELSDTSGPARISAARDRLEAGDPEAALVLLDGVPHRMSADARPLRERAETEYIEKTLSEDLPADARPKLLRSEAELRGEALRPEEYFLLSRVDGHATIGEIIDIAPAREVETITVLRRLVRRGLMAVPKAESPSASQSTTPELVEG